MKETVTLQWNIVSGVMARITHKSRTWLNTLIFSTTKIRRYWCGSVFGMAAKNKASRIFNEILTSLHNGSTSLKSFSSFVSGPREGRTRLLALSAVKVFFSARGPLLWRGSSIHSSAKLNPLQVLVVVILISDTQILVYRRFLN